MSLPKINLPRYKHHLKGIDKKISFRTFTNKEQKILLLAKEEKSNEQMIESIKQIVELCTFGEVNVSDLPYFDLEDLFMQIRIKSVSDVSDLSYKVTKENGDVEMINVSIDLKKIRVEPGENHTNKIQLDEKIGMVMKYPTIDMLSELDDETEMLEHCIEYIYDENEVYYLKDVSKQEKDEFIESLDVVALKKVKHFFDTMPRLRYKHIAKLKDGENVTIKIEGLSDFF